jgi:thioesterase domain-containing protein
MVQIEKDIIMSIREYLSSKIQSSIKITDAMGITVTDFSNSSLTLSAPIEKNINDKSTAFAGSIYSLLVLASWALIEGSLKKQGIDADVMVTESSVEFKKAVNSDFTAKATFENSGTIPDFSSLLSGNGKTGIKMVSEIQQKDETAVIFRGLFFIKENRLERNPE